MKYEKEGVVLDLPHFWLPDFKMWLEVKGEIPIHEERDFFAQLARVGIVLS